MSTQATQPLLQVIDLHKHYAIKGGVLARQMGTLQAVAGVSFSILPGQTLGLVGESGCGKSTLGRTLMRLEEPTRGQVLFDGQDMARARGSALMQLRREMQMVFQDPYASLNPRMTVGDIVREPLQVHRMGSKAEQLDRVHALLQTVGLGAEVMSRYPSEFSGGQRQRIGVARALALQPRLVVADEPVSALDVSVQSQVLNLLVDLQRELGLSYLFISHDLSVVQHISDVVAIMYLGCIVEMGPVRAVFDQPAHPYTRALLQAIPSGDPRQRKRATPLTGEAPSQAERPSGCVFAPRCPHAIGACRAAAPATVTVQAATTLAPVHQVACIRHGDVLAQAPSR